MAFQQFGFPQVLTDLGLTLADADLYETTPPAPVRPELAETVRYGATLATPVGSEKARSEFVVAPILVELRRLHGGAFSLFSGVDLVADPSRGLNGTCDFLLARSPSQLVVSAPIFTIVEAKKESIEGGLGQCIASMVAAQMVNEKAGRPVAAVHGAVTTGSVWKFLRLSGTLVTVDSAEYAVADLPKLFGILGSIVALPPVTAPS